MCQRMTANLIRSQSSSPPRSRLVRGNVEVQAPRHAMKPSLGNPKHVETVRALREVFKSAL